MGVKRFRVYLHLSGNNLETGEIEHRPRLESELHADLEYAIVDMFYRGFVRAREKESCEENVRIADGTMDAGPVEGPTEGPAEEPAEGPAEKD